MRLWKREAVFKTKIMLFLIAVIQRNLETFVYGMSRDKHGDIGTITTNISLVDFIVKCIKL